MYERYVPLDEQVEVLRELGFTLQEEKLQELEQSLEEEPSYRVWLEGDPYAALIGMAAYPEYDMENWKIRSFSEQAYWFDWEGMDLEEDYCNILRGVEVISGGELHITDMAVDGSKANWEQGNGTLSIGFSVNGIAQVSKVRIENDWLDSDFLDDVRSALKAAGMTEKQLYSMDDSGQGCILLYRTPEWAKEFTEKTGITLR